VFISDRIGWYCVNKELVFSILKGKFPSKRKVSTRIYKLKHESIRMNNLERGQVIIQELLSSLDFLQKRGKSKQLTTIGIIGRMEAGKSTLMRQLNQWSGHEVKIVLDDKSLLSMKQSELDEFTKIRHLHPNKRILLVISAHRYKLLAKTIRTLCTAIIWVSPPPPWELEDVRFFQKLQDEFDMEFPDTPYTGMIIWRNWVTQQTEWGWIGWEFIPEGEVTWTQQGFKQKEIESKQPAKEVHDKRPLRRRDFPKIDKRPRGNVVIKHPTLYIMRYSVAVLFIFLIVVIYLMIGMP